MPKVANKKNNFSYQSLYLWTCFLWGIISLGIIIWNREKTPFTPVMPAGSRYPVHRDVEALHPCNLNPCTHAGSRQDSSFVTALALSALTYQKFEGATSSLLIGLGFFINQARTQVMATFDLNNLKATEGIMFSGGSYTGQSVYATDMNKDKNLDILIGAYGANKAYLVYGPTFNMTDLDNLNSKQGVVFTGGLRTGIDIYAADLNNDSHMDILVGAMDANKLYLVYGPVFNVTNLDSLGNQGIVFTGGVNTGYSIHVADVNRDGNLDILVGAPSANKTYLIYGPSFNVTNLDNLNRSQGIIFTGGQHLGRSMYVADFNKDGNMDILMGASGVRKIYLVYGPAFQVTNLDNLNAQQGVIFSGAAEAGYSVSAADMNKDGNIDVLVGAYTASKVYLVYGPTFNQSNLDNLNSQQGLVFSGGQYTGLPVRAADMDMDGNMDLLIGAFGVAKTYLVYGPNFANATNLEVLALKQGVIFTGGVTQANYAADIDGDDKLDFIIGAEGNNKTYVVYNSVFNIFPLAKTTSKALVTTPTSGSTSTTNTEKSAVITLTLLSSPSTAVTESLNTEMSANNNLNISVGSASGVAVGICVAGALIGAAGFFAVNKCGKSKSNVESNNNEVSLQNRSSSTQLSSRNYGEIDATRKDSQQYDRPVELKI